MFSYFQKIALVILTAACGYYYLSNLKLNQSISDLKETNKTLEDNNRILSDNNDKNEKYIKSLKSNISEVMFINEKLSLVTAEQDKKIKDILINSTKHNVPNVALKKPKLVQQVINKGTFKEFRCIEQITKGSPNECK